MIAGKFFSSIQHAHFFLQILPLLPFLSHSFTFLPFPSFSYFFLSFPSFLFFLPSFLSMSTLAFPFLSFLYMSFSLFFTCPFPSPSFCSLLIAFSVNVQELSASFFNISALIRERFNHVVLVVAPLASSRCTCIISFSVLQHCSHLHTTRNLSIF